MMISTTLFRNLEDCQTYTAGQTIFTVGDPGDCMYAVAEGEVDIIVGTKVMETLGPGGIMGEMALIEHKPRSANAVAKTDCKLVPISEKRFQFLVQNTPFFSLQIMKIMADRLRRTDAHLTA